MKSRKAGKAEKAEKGGCAVVMMETGKVRPYDNNPRNNEGAVDYVKESIRSFGFKIPIVVDEDNVILAGHTRLLAALALGMAEVPCVVARGLTDEQKTAYRIADNRAGELTLFDFEKLAAEIGKVQVEAPDIDLGGVDIEDTGREIDCDDFGDETFKHECPHCGLKF